MKELSIEEKAKRYDEALEIAREINNEKCAQNFNIMTRVFPELKESEDERIRKAIHIYLDWLDGRKDYAPKGEYSIRDMIAWLEKQGGQKPVDKVEPKFGVGDWVVFNNKHQSIYQVEKIEDGYYLLRHTRGGTFRVCVLHDESLRLWTVEDDAKDGDVLCTYECDEPKIVFVLKGTPKKHYALSYYCYYNIMYPYFEPDSKTGCLAPNEEGVKPATKEQRNLLFTKMKEEGYVWNKDTKKLIKL